VPDGQYECSQQVNFEVDVIMVNSVSSVGAADQTGSPAKSG